MSKDKTHTNHVDAQPFGESYLERARHFRRARNAWMVQPGETLCGAVLATNCAPCTKPRGERHGRLHRHVDAGYWTDDACLGHDRPCEALDGRCDLLAGHRGNHRYGGAEVYADDDRCHSHERYGRCEREAGHLLPHEVDRDGETMSWMVGYETTKPRAEWSRRVSEQVARLELTTPWDPYGDD